MPRLTNIQPSTIEMQHLRKNTAQPEEAYHLVIDNLIDTYYQPNRPIQAKLSSLKYPMQAKHSSLQEVEKLGIVGAITRLFTTSQRFYDFKQKAKLIIYQANYKDNGTITLKQFSNDFTKIFTINLNDISINNGLLNIIIDINDPILFENNTKKTYAQDIPKKIGLDADKASVLIENIVKYIHEFNNIPKKYILPSSLLY